MFRFYLGDILLPVAPGDISISEKNNNTTVSLIGEDEYTILKKPGLTKYKFKAMIPSKNYNFAFYSNEGFKEASFYIEELNNLKRNKTVFDFTVIDSLNGSLIVSETVSIEEITQTRSADDERDIWLDISLQKYVYHSLKTVVITDNTITDTTETPQTNTGAPILESYTIKSGDTLWTIALKFYGDSSKSSDIYQLNKAVLDAEAVKRGMPSETGDWWIFPGVTINLPPK